MKFKIDENLPVEFVDILGAANHDAAEIIFLLGIYSPSLKKGGRGD